ncbi:MAG: nucleotide pyrophosphohydrolase [Candidatus Pacebacteria bacterium]|nr:nucleotide pyrophosphohydrolase [Candidatus Paceibacterota bacterium]MCF7857560.1 nucleotide pyrophosphohydrolase [Candidatus Paceibacterota bacterium]
MNIPDLTKKALHIKGLYSDFEKKKSYKAWTAEETYAGLVSDVGDLGRLVLAKEGFREVSDLNKNLEHELAEILWATLLLSVEYKIDLSKAFLDEMIRLEKELLK